VDINILSDFSCTLDYYSAVLFNLIVRAVGNYHCVHVRLVEVQSCKSGNHSIPLQLRVPHRVNWIHFLVDYFIFFLFCVLYFNVLSLLLLFVR